MIPIRIIKRFKHFLEQLLDHCAKNRVSYFLLRAYYQLATHCLASALKVAKFDSLIKIYLRHNRWILPISDIDLVCLIKRGEPRDDMVFFRKFWKLYGFLRVFFPMLCTSDEIRFIHDEQIHKHPLRTKTDALALFTPDQWLCLYSKKGSGDGIPVWIMYAAESTRHWNMYCKLQWPLIAGQIITELKFRRLSGIMLKLTQHLYFLKENKAIDIPSLGKLPFANDFYLQTHTIPSNPLRRRSILLHSFQKLIFLMDRIHSERFDLSYGLIPVRHSSDDHWLGSPLKDFIREGKSIFGGQFQIAVLKPLGEYNARAFLLLKESWSPAIIQKLMTFANQHNQKLFESRVRLMFGTESIIASQFYALWSPHALEAHILLVRESYNPDGHLKIKLPPHEWVVWKIRNSVSIFEEYNLPFLISSQAKGAGIDFCKIYERFEVEVLFHYFSYLRNRETYENDLMRTNGDSLEMMAITASRYGNEMGTGDWRPYSYASAYPYVRQMIRLVDTMARRETERISRKRYEENISSHK